MSSSLYWMPKPVEPKKNNIGYLDQILAKEVWKAEDKYFCTDEREVGDWLVPFLKGLVAGGSAEIARDAQKLISAIEKYGSVILMIRS